MLASTPAPHLKLASILFAFALVLSAQSSYAEEVSAIPACAPSGAVTPICGVQAPEDLELLPGGTQLLISQMPAGADHQTGGGLALVDLASHQIKTLPIRDEWKAGWGDPDCNAPLERLAPHGVHLSRRSDGNLELLVVNHFGRESIEMLELVLQDGAYAGIWRGCVVMRPAGVPNDVTATGDGGFIATIMFDRSLLAQKEGRSILLSGADTGHLVEWHPARGLVRLPRSEAPANNGVQLSADRQFIYFAAWTGKQVRKFDRTLQRVTQVVDLPFYPDNLTVRADGQLVVTGNDELGSFKACMQAHAAFCMTAWTVVALDPDTMSITPVYHAPQGLIAGASVALQIGQSLYVGSYAGDRLLKIALPR